MTGKPLVVAALLLTGLSNAAVAAEPLEHRSKNAHKIIAVLSSMGVTNPDIRKLVTETDARVKNGYVSLYEERINNGTLKLHFETSGSISAKQIELRYTPDDSNFVYTARPNAVMVNYNFKF